MSFFTNVPQVTAEGKLFNVGKFMGNNYEVRLKLEQTLMSVTREDFQ